MLSIMKKKLIVQIGYIETRRFYHDFIAFDNEYWKGKKEVYSRFNGLSYIDAYYYEDDIKIDTELHCGNFSADHYEQLTHEIICLADKLKTINLNDIKNLVNTYKNEKL